MSTQHTPGPWELSEGVYKDGFGTYRRIEQVEQFGDVVGSVCIRHEINHTLNEAGEANARLIAAAPDLLAFCKQLAKRPTDYLCAEDWEALEAAIAKAGGAV